MEESIENSDQTDLSSLPVLYKLYFHTNKEFDFHKHVNFHKLMEIIDQQNEVDGKYLHRR